MLAPTLACLVAGSHAATGTGAMRGDAFGVMTAVKEEADGRVVHAAAPDAPPPGPPADEGTVVTAADGRDDGIANRPTDRVRVEPRRWEEPAFPLPLEACCREAVAHPGAEFWS